MTEATQPLSVSVLVFPVSDRLDGDGAPLLPPAHSLPRLVLSSLSDRLVTPFLIRLAAIDASDAGRVVGRAFATVRRQLHSHAVEDCGC